jgi:uncharacterized protein (DUF2252 family)
MPRAAPSLVYRSGVSRLPPPRQERLVAGKALRARVSRSSHGQWKPAATRPDPIGLLEAADRHRLPELLPLRYARMLVSPFTFFRGAALLMASDLAETPVTELMVQACGDAHCSNFGAYATPERRLVFDVNDFDETLPGPWEWDLKRLVTSLVLASRQNGFAATTAAEAVLASAQAYREQMRAFCTMTYLDIWSFRIDEAAIDAVTAPQSRLALTQTLARARHHTQLAAFPTLVEGTGSSVRLKDEPPLITHLRDDQLTEHIHATMARYQASLEPDRQALLQRYRFIDVAQKVVGVGSVGTRCYVTLWLGDDDRDPLFLQLKEAQASVLEAWWGKSAFPNHAQRVVAGQRLMQAASDIFLGWTHEAQHDYYVRQLQDHKGSADMTTMRPQTLVGYARLCGLALARAHARSGDPASISGYLGMGSTFDRALARFATAYANQTGQDHAALVAAVKAGRIRAAAAPAP